MQASTMHRTVGWADLAASLDPALLMLPDLVRHLALLQLPLALTKKCAISVTRIHASKNTNMIAVPRVRYPPAFGQHVLAISHAL